MHEYESCDPASVALDTFHFSNFAKKKLQQKGVSLISFKSISLRAVVCGMNCHCGGVYQVPPKKVRGIKQFTIQRPI